MKKVFLFILGVTFLKVVGQPGKDGALTVTTPSQVVNRYMPVSENINSGQNTFVIATNSSFGLCPGDLVMIYQAQGASIDVTNTNTYGNILNYNDAGLFEFKYVQSVNSNTITVQTTFTNSYSSSGKVQMIKVPQYTTLTINLGATIVPRNWKDTTISTVPYRFGGLVVVHASNIINNGSIVSSGSGFRGGALLNDPATNTGATAFVSTVNNQGGEKGEGIFGNFVEYDNNGGRYCMGSPANGGGGGNNHNAGGGGGANGFNGNTWTGEGVMVVDASNPLVAWSLSSAYVANANALTTSSGGGHGGYTWASANANALVTGPNNAAWAGDNRREVGGRGGRPLTNINAETRIYFGGGGGAPHENNSSSSPGSNGGGIIYLIATTGITGAGTIESNGLTAGNASICSCDAAPGAGAGGSIVLKTGAIVPTQTVNANGGNGGNQLVLTSPGNNNIESEGPGGGGGGGFIAVSSPGSVNSFTGGLNGSSLSGAMTEFPFNGATSGATGQSLTVSPNFISYNPIAGTFTITNNSPICAGATLSFTTNATGTTFNWTGPNSFTSAVQNPTIGNATPLASGVYFLTLGSGCAGASTTVSVLPQPTVTIFNITGSQSITCISPTVDLAAVSNYPGTLNYFWASNTFTANTPTITVVSANTLITLSVNDPVYGCSASATTAISVNTIAPVSSVGPVNQIINCGPGVVATATGVAISPTINVSHQWFGPDGLINPPTGGLISIYNPVINGANGTSTFVLTNLINGCSTTKTVQVVSSAGGYPSFGISSNLSVNAFTLGCGTRSVTDVNIINAQTFPTGGGAISYTILPPSFTGTNYTTNTTAAYTVNVPGTYTLIVKDNVNLCESRVPLSVIQNTAGPVIVITASTRTLSCDIPTVSLEGSSPNQNVTYTWKDNGNPPSFPNGTITINTTTAGAAVPSGTVVDNYTLTVIDNSTLGNHCPSSTVVTIYQNTRPPKANIALSNPALTCIIYSVNLSNNSSTGILPGTFFATQNVVATLWEGPTPQEPLSNSSTYLGYTAGVYTMTVKDLNNGCTSQTTTTVGDNRIYPVLVTNTQVALDCGATATGGVKLPVTALNLAPAAITALWQTPVPTPNISGVNTLTLTTDGPGIYTLTVITNSNGCGSAVNVEVTNGILNADFTADRQSGFAPLTVNFTNQSASSSTVNGTSSITAVWSFGNGTTKTTTVNTSNANAATTAVYTQPGTYTVTMFAAKGSCFDSVSKVIHVDIPSKLEVPNVFTPNGDNSNDIFFVKTANLSEITALIYDRWGNKIYELTTEKGNIAWDGKNQAGKEAPDGTYFYVITATGKDGQSYNTKGTVSLFR